MDFKIRILGANSALPKADSFASAQVVLYNNTPYLIDCAEGTQVLMRRYKVSFGKLKHIFISHLHGDHFYGIFGLLSTLNLLGRKQKLNIYAPKKLKEIISYVFNHSTHPLAYKINFIDLSKSGKELICTDKNFCIYSFPLIHGIDSFGFLFQEKKKQPNIRKDVIKKYNIEIEDILKIKAGEDFTTKSGRVVKNHLLTNNPIQPRSYAYCSDTIFIKDMNKYIDDIDLLYHEATFADSDRGIASKTMHSTARQAALTAKNVNAKKLIIGHFSTRYESPEVLLKEARKVFINTVSASEGLLFEL